MSIRIVTESIRKKFNETSLPSEEDLYSNLNMENIDDIDYRHGNNVFKRFELENLGDYHDLYVQSDTLLLADVFENFRYMCIKEYELDPAHFLLLPGVAWRIKKHRIRATDRLRHAINDRRRNKRWNMSLNT